MERINNTTPAYDLVRNLNNLGNSSESNDLCEDCYMRNQSVKAEFTCTECKINICINCSVRQHKQHADKFHNIYEYVDKYEGEYFHNHMTNLQILGMEIKELFDKECEPLDRALTENLREGKRRKEILEHLQQKLHSLAEEDDTLQNDILWFLSQEKKNRKQKQKKLEESVKKATRYIEFHTEKVIKTKSVQERALDINTDFLKEDSEKIQEAYSEELKKIQGNGYTKKIDSLTNQTTAILNYENKLKSIESDIAELYKNYQLAITNFKKEAKIPEGAPRLISSEPHLNYENRRNLINSNSGLNVGINAQNGLTPRDDVEMLNIKANSSASLNQKRNSNVSLNENRNEFSVFDMPVEQADNDSKIPKYPSFNSDNAKNPFIAKQNSKNASSSKDLIYHNQNTPISNLNAASFASSINPSVASASQLDSSNFLGSAVVQQSSILGSQTAAAAANQNQNSNQNASSNYNSSQKIPVVNNSSINLGDSKTITNFNNANNTSSSNVNSAVSANAYFIGIKSKPNNEIVVFNSFTNTLKTLKIDESCYSFEDKLIPKPTNFPYENSKYVNIGANSALITGGNYQKSASDHCFKLTVLAPAEVSSQSSLQSEKIQISKWPNLLSKRERHNILFLPDQNQVLVCSGFYVKSCEYTEVSSALSNNLNNSSEVRKWKKLPELAEPRGNATMFYLNNQYVYILGGFKVNDSTGEYLNSLEYIDFAKKDKWNFINIEALTRQYSLRISAMGCVGLGNDRILLVGGYDGSSYLKSGFTVEFENGVIKSFDKKENLLSRGSIFFSNPMFMKISEDVLFNFELQAKAIMYDVLKGEFQFFSQAQPQA